jgi:hypothetical protein
MAAWPELAELKQVLDVTSEDWDGDDDDSRLTGLLAAAVQHVKDETGQDTETPSVNLSRAALRMAELMALKPELVAQLGFTDPTYERFIYGQRRQFGIG